MDEMTDERLDGLVKYLHLHPGGFVNYAIMADELLSALLDLKRYREKPLHCPGCDGDHL